MQFLLSIFLFIFSGYHSLNNIIQNILKQKAKTKKKNSIGNQQTIKNSGKSNKNKKRSSLNKMDFPPKKYSIKLGNNNNIDKKNSIKIKKRNTDILLENKGRNIDKKSKTKNYSTLKKFINNRKKKLKDKLKISYNDFELNSFDYRNSILNDKRTFCQYYLSLLRSKNLILFSFLPTNDYNTMIIKLCIFSLSFSIYYIVNFAFFNEKIIHEIYLIGGKYDYIYFLPKIIISFAISYVITNIIKYIFLSERNIYEIRIQPTYPLAVNITIKERRNLVIKYTIFFILGIIFLVFFWMLLSSFGAVYQNSQMFIFKNTSISFSLSLFYPFIIIIFPSIFRILSLNYKEKNSEYMFKLSKFLRIL